MGNNANALANGSYVKSLINNSVIVNNVDDTIDEILYLIMISLEGKEIPKKLIQF